MSLDWTNPVVVITGASSGIGKATARAFAERGAKLVLAARRKNLLDDLVDECEELGTEAIAVRADVSDNDDVEDIYKRAIKEFGNIDIWVNNAGVGSLGRFDEIPVEEHEQLVRTNLLGVIFGSSCAIRHFRERGKGVLINVGSVESKVPIAYHAVYAATKHGVAGLSAAIREELSINDEDNIHVCTVMPPSINTPFFKHAGNHFGRKSVPVPPVYPPEAVADVIVDAAWNPKDEVAVAGAGKMMVKQRRLAPKLTVKQVGWQQHKAHMKAPEAEETSGSVFKPMSEGTEAKDEWTESGKYVDKLGIGLMSVIPVVGGLWLWRKLRERGDIDINRAA